MRYRPIIIIIAITLAATACGGNSVADPSPVSTQSIDAIGTQIASAVGTSVTDALATATPTETSTPSPANCVIEVGTYRGANAYDVLHHYAGLFREGYDDILGTLEPGAGAETADGLSEPIFMLGAIADEVEEGTGWEVFNWPECARAEQRALTHAMSTAIVGLGFRDMSIDGWQADLDEFEDLWRQYLMLIEQML